MGIDLGLNTVAAVVTNTGMNPILFGGKPIKSINQYYNKQTGKLKSALRNGKEFHEGSYMSKRLEKYAQMRHLKIKDLFHKVSFKIVNLALTEQVDIIVIGTNQGWKQRVNLGKMNNQHFVSVPFAMFISMIAYKANKVGIQVVQTEESYT
ncbi:IS200/IS605 family accessory protein TnpB-related protein [Pseudogracilibacillus auburnensis]|uniref:IS200/IS605 family accessory protein TnpB-related protein n=1 Tax=Pseudogracilibacillus auburnensis TaxID=1494959 RepID=UPI001A97741E|nr:IS200/IS605 family accessory protein TnpB-related protein [Pseudogracilibacillus auburnensis]MBO1006004.1 IS200/IS605 family accessory protein TnpB-related protein [Pseudogracilibacillus auburnensis]